jgi:hypothetical protein
VNGVGEFDARIACHEALIDLVDDEIAAIAALNVHILWLREIAHVAVVLDGAWSRELAIYEIVGAIVRYELVG